MKILVIDIGGTHVKLLVTGRTQPVKFASGPSLTPNRMIREISTAVAEWKFDAVSIGYPGPVVAGKPAEDPANLGAGWIRFNFERAWKRPVKIVNDAAMQAMGSYEGGRMLFLGLGTGLGSAFVCDGVLQPLELAHLPYRHGRTYEEYAGIRGLKRLGFERWRHHVTRIVALLKHGLQADYVVLGGGNVKKFDALPPDCHAGDNANAFVGGFRLWQASHHYSGRKQAHTKHSPRPLRP